MALVSRHTLATNLEEASSQQRSGTNALGQKAACRSAHNALVLGAFSPSCALSHDTEDPARAMMSAHVGNSRTAPIVKTTAPSCRGEREL
jgi:hypothetical protein